MKTSAIAEQNKVVAAINGGFFDMDKGGSVHYFELRDSTINRTKPAGSKCAKSNSLANGAIVLTNALRAKFPHYYGSPEDSGVTSSHPVNKPNEDFVLKALRKRKLKLYPLNLILFLSNQNRKLRLWFPGHF